jgi:protein-glutamine gamma-glutamyltransferase
MKQPSLSSQHLNWLLCSLLSVLAIHSLNLPLWVTFIALALGAWRLLIEKKQSALPKMRVLVPITTLICLGLILNFKDSFGRDASVSLLVIMCAMKLLETKTVRDYLLMIAIAYFLVSSTFIFSQTASTFILSLIPLTLLTATLIQTSLPHTEKTPFVLRLAGKMLLQSIPLMLVLFVLFPRLPGPIWGISKDAYSGMTGLDDTLEIGDVGNLIRNSSIAFRVQFDSPIPDTHELYWRGPVLWKQQGNKWITSNDPQLPYESLTSASAPIKYTMTLEPHNRLWMLLLDMPTTLPKTATRRHDFTTVAQNPVRTRIRYQATSYRRYVLGETLTETQRIFGLQINEQSNPQSRALAKSWSHLNTEEIITTALQKFRQENFIYTLKPPLLSENAIDDFLFNTKKGFCEYYASSFVFLMRAAGVPARIVTGYQGGEVNPKGDYLIVRQSDAHAWAEVWLKDIGWVRVDPTAAVAPERIEQGIDEAITELDELPMFVGKVNPWLKAAYLNWDSLNNNWNQWVLGYDNEKQLDFLNKLTGKDLKLTDIAIGMIAALLSIMLFTAIFILYQRKAKPSPIERLYQQYLKQLKKQGLSPKTGEAAEDFAQRVAEALPHQASNSTIIAKQYNALRYSANQDIANQLKLFKEVIQTFLNGKQ